MNRPIQAILIDCEVVTRDLHRADDRASRAIRSVSWRSRFRRLTREFAFRRPANEAMNSIESRYRNHRYIAKPRTCSLSKM
jgi:hypothetical protein